MVDTEEALSGPLDKAEAVYRANLEMRCFRQEVVRVVLLDVQNYWITSVDVCKGTLDESLAHPREIFRPMIVHAAAGFVLVHNLWAAIHRLCYVACGFMCGMPGNAFEYEPLPSMPDPADYTLLIY